MLKNATIHFNALGTPVADHFDDVYFSNDDGQAESNYVFFLQNKLDHRLEDPDLSQFVIAETGFGTGLNFLNVWQKFDQIPASKRVKQLHFISFEKYPIHPDQLPQALALWPELEEFATQLCQQYPCAVAGCHRLKFAQGSVILDLWFGDVHQILEQISLPSDGLVDAWFLDGFAPSKNPDMWQPHLFQKMSELSRPNATFATFTAAGFVRRSLQEVGFSVSKVKGYGRKREMLVGKLTEEPNHQTNIPAYYQRSTELSGEIAIIGGGISSSCLRYQLAERGFSSDLFCRDPELAQGASHNRQAAIYPNLQIDSSVYSQFMAHSFLYAKRFYNKLAKAGYHFPHDWCGVLLQGITPEKVQQQQKLIDKAQWPETLIQQVSAEQASQIAGLPLPYSGLFIKEGGWVEPAQLTKVIDRAAQDLHDGVNHFNTEITQLHKQQDGWYLHSQQKKFGPYQNVFICAGEHSAMLSQHADFPIYGVRGQVSHIEAGQRSQQLQTVLCHKGYFTPAYQGIHAMGATFDKHNNHRDNLPEDDVRNHQQLMQWHQKEAWAKEMGQITGSKAAIRCYVPDHLPLVGQVPDLMDYTEAFAPLRQGKQYGFSNLTSAQKGLHIVTGFGARGFAMAPLATELLISSLLKVPLPCTSKIDQALHPARFIIRDLIRNKR